MSSPFTTIEEFNNVLDGPTEGAIYTFANTPIINTLALLVSVGIFIWFIIATYSSHEAPASSMEKSLNHLSSFIVVGLLSLVTATSQHPNRQVRPEQPTATGEPTLRDVYQSSSRKVPLGLLGMVGVGLPKLRRMSKRKTRYKRPAYSSKRRRTR